MCWGKGKRQTHYFKPFITCINISAEINKGWQACLEDSCSSLRLASLEWGLLGCHAYWPPVKPLHLFLIIHLEQGDWKSCQGELLRWYGMDILWGGTKRRGRSPFLFGRQNTKQLCSTMSVASVCTRSSLLWCFTSFFVSLFCCYWNCLSSLFVTERK